jgi:AhpC/TSA family
LLAVVPALGALSNNTQQDKSPKEQYTALEDQYQKLQIEFSKLYNAAKTDEERKELLTKLPDASPFAEKMLKIAEKYPKDAVALDALVWVVRITGFSSNQAKQAFEVIAKNYLEDPQIVKVLPLYARNADGNEKLLQTVIEKNADKAAQGLACFYLAQNLKYQSQVAERQKKSEAAAELIKKVEALFDRVVKDYGDIHDPRDSKDKRLRDLVEPELFEMRFLMVGKTVPDIQAEDLDGKTFKLSDYRGKVVMLDFWGHW